MDYIIGVDIGTSGTKAIAFRLAGSIIAEYHVSYSLLNPQPGHFEQDPNVLLSAVVESIARVVQTVKKGAVGTQLLGVGFSSAMHGLIAMDRQDQPLTNCITWADTRSESFATRLKGTPHGIGIYLKTGTPIHPMSPLCKLCWIRTHLPIIFSKAQKFISIKEYVFLRLFGRYLVDESIASATGLFDIYAFQWHAPALDLAGISSMQLSEPVPITYTLSGLTKRYADDMGIPVDTPFIVGGSDGCLANLGAHAVGAGEATVSIGTSGAIRMMSNHPVTDQQARTFCYALTDNLFVLGGAVNSGGVALRWYGENFGPAGVPQATAFELLANDASTVPAGAEGLVFLPYLAGERAPHWNAKAKGMFFGVQMHHRKAHFTRAVFEGVIYGMYSVGKVLEEIAGPIKVIHANGGFARSSLWVQLLADVFNRQVLVREESVEDAAKGAYIVALKALGKISDFDALAHKSEQDRYDPNPAVYSVYMENFDRFGRLYDKIKDEF
ncbi:gluconate kinase [Parapedobacter pyrenivorans]|uniref:Gluconate kinase n=1 Tax=Parapedobacter pyrenivorans TaxID=1305674 RepID=A0A917I263_9SPHI|nr:gluconokinase [Parapedobacter pyrenivorans]GGH02520.1 gluconate kinase [Parapedobacter pyrenivorans]